jgi:NDP-mannose synthase
MKKRAIILAGGKGTRLMPYTMVFPKPLVPIGEYPILEIVIRQLVKNGFDHITLTVNHQADLIKAYFGNGEKWKTYIDYSYESHPLGTMGPLRLINNLPETFLVMNGDILTDLNFESYYNSFNTDFPFSILAKYRQDKLEYGVLEVNEDNTLIGFREKPVVSHLVSTGIYMLCKEVLKFIPENGPFGFDELMLEMIKQNQKVKVIPFEGFWLDIGRPDDYASAVEKYDELKHLWSDNE